MYTIEQLDNRIIWLFREHRAGSTWLTHVLSKELKRENCFLNFNPSGNYSNRAEVQRAYVEAYRNRKPEKDDHKKLLNTHSFYALESLNNYDNPIVVRILRKDRTEQFISSYIAENFTKKFNVYSVAEYNLLPNIEPFTINPKEVGIRDLLNKQVWWDKFAHQYENETIYYEDLLQGYKSKLFGLNFLMDPLKEDGTLKLPYDKRKLVKNYDEVDEILKKLLGP